MAKRFGLSLLVLATLAIAAAYGAAFLPGGAPRASAWLMALGIPALMVALMIMGSARNGRIGVLWVPFAFVFLVVAGGFAAVLLSQPDLAGSALVLGVPARTAIVLYGIGLLPLIAMPVGYALTFNAMTLREEDLERVRRARREAVS